MLATASALLKKIESTPVKPAKKVALAYSGGLDSSLCVALAHHKYQVEQLIAVTADVGQGKAALELAVDKPRVLRSQPVLIHAREGFATHFLPRAITPNSS